MKFLRIAIIALVGFLITNCDENTTDNNKPDNAAVNSCEGCHTNYAHLKAVFTPIQLLVDRVAVVKLLITNLSTEFI